MPNKIIKQLITDDDINWVKNSQQLDINKITGDELLAGKSAHMARKFKQNMIYAARRSNVNTHRKHFTEELNFHEKRHGWWDNDNIEQH